MKNKILLLGILLVLALSILSTTYADEGAETAQPVLDVAINNFTEHYCKNEDNEYVLRRAFLFEVTDRDALSENGKQQFSDHDAAVYLIVDQYVFGFPMPHCMELCYYVDANDKVQGDHDILGSFDIFNWQTDFAGIEITEVTEAAQAAWPAGD